jgi:anthranilate synthase component 2
MPELVRTYAPTKSIFGVCLGHQCIGEVFGGLLLNIAAPIHGKATPITLTDRSEPLFKGLPERISVGRYHSWVVSQEKFPNELAITAVDEAGAIMALRHTRYDVCGVQFHPESILTQDGKMMLENWISYERAA